MRDGTILYWCVCDEETGEPVIRCEGRAEARRIVRECGGFVAKLVRWH